MNTHQPRLQTVQEMFRQRRALSDPTQPAHPSPPPGRVPPAPRDTDPETTTAAV